MKTTGKRILSLLLCLVLVLALLPTAVSAAEEASDPDNPLNIRYNPVTEQIEWDRYHGGNVYWDGSDYFRIRFDWHNGENNRLGLHPEQPEEDAFTKYPTAYYGPNLLFMYSTSRMEDDTMIFSASDVLDHCSRNLWEVNEKLSYMDGIHTTEADNQTGVYIPPFGGTASIRGWFQVWVEHTEKDEFGYATVVESTANIWIDWSYNQYPSTVTRCGVELVDGEPYLYFDPIKNRGEVNCSVYGTPAGTNNEMELAFVRAIPGENYIPLAEAARWADLNPNGWKPLKIDLRYYSEDREFFSYFEFTLPMEKLLGGDDSIRWTDYNDGFVARWDYEDMIRAGIDHPKASKTQAEARLYKIDLEAGLEGYNATPKCVERMIIPLKDGYLQPGSIDWSQAVVKHGSGWYKPVISYRDDTTSNQDLVHECVSGQYRLYNVADYIHFTSQSPANGETVKIEKPNYAVKVPFSYSVAELPRWMKKAGVTFTSNYAYLYVNGDPFSELNSTMPMVKDSDTSWHNEATINYVGNHTLFYRVYVMVNGNLSDTVLDSSIYIRATAPKPPSATDFTFITQPTDQVVKNGEKPVFTWETNMNVPTVFLETSTDNGENWMNHAKIASDVKSGSYTYAPRNVNYAHTRQLLRLRLRDSEGKSSYSDPFYVTWTNDGKEPTAVSLPSKTQPNGKEYRITVPFNYGATSSSDTQYKTRFILFETDEEGNRIANVGGHARIDSVSNGTGLEVVVWSDGYENSFHRFVLCIYNSNKPTDNNSLGIPAQSVSFSAAWTELPIIYDITYEPNGGTGKMYPTYMHADEEGWASYTFPACEYTAPAGMTFDHWEYRYEDHQVFNYTAVPGETISFNRGIVIRPVWKAMPEDCGGDPAVCPGAVFTDMPAYGNWAHNPIDWAVDNGITSGTSSTKFSPNKTCTRGQIVTFLWRAAGKPEPTTTSCDFADVKPTDYFYKAVLWAVEEDITKGTSITTFSPNKDCTRGQIVTFLWRAKGEPKPTNTNHSFTDIKSGEYYYTAVLWAVEKGVTSGTSKTAFSPNESCTRAQAVTFLYRAFN